MHALIIEAECFTAQLIEDCLRDLGFTSFAFAADEEVAITEASVRCPGLITADVHLASGCGINAVQRICVGGPIPVLYITTASSAVRERCPSAAIVLKPFAISDLMHGIHQARQSC